MTENCQSSANQVDMSSNPFFSPAPFSPARLISKTSSCDRRKDLASLGMPRVRNSVRAQGSRLIAGSAVHPICFIKFVRELRELPTLGSFIRTFPKAEFDSPPDVHC